MNHIKKTLWAARLAFQGNVLKDLRQLQKWQWLDTDQTRRLQEDLLERLLIHAYQHVPYYRDVLAGAGVASENNSIHLDRFQQIPLLDKVTIRLRYCDLKSDDLDSRKWYENTSGGSTGEPVRLIQDNGYRDMLGAVKMLDDLWSGYAMSERKAVLWGSERDIFAGSESIKTLTGRWLRSEIWFNAFRMTPAQMGECVKKINTFQPVQILAYVGNMYELSRFIEREKLAVYSPAAIMATAGALQTPMRETIERVFKSPVFNRYGSREVGDIACECNCQKGLHITAPVQYIEVLRPDGSRADTGEVGEIVVTNLTNYAMPLIRYRIGDMGSLSAEPCPCGRGWPLLKEIAGRTSDIFVTKQGTHINGEYFTHLFYFKDWIRKFQVIQEDYNLIHILIVVSEQKQKPRDYYAEELREITDKIRIVMEDCSVEYDFVDDIAPTQSGKYRYTISKVSSSGTSIQKEYI